jgi:hypothetical protein
VYALVRPWLEPLGWFGDIATGIVSVAGYLGGIMVAAPLAFGEPAMEISDRGDAIVIAALCVLFGSIVGHFWSYTMRRVRSTAQASPRES